MGETFLLVLERMFSHFFFEFGLDAFAFRKFFGKVSGKLAIEWYDDVHKVFTASEMRVFTCCKRKTSGEMGKKRRGPLDGNSRISIIGVVPVGKTAGPPDESRAGLLKDLEMCLSDAPVKEMTEEGKRAGQTI